MILCIICFYLSNELITPDNFLLTKSANAKYTEVTYRAAKEEGMFSLSEH